MGIEIQPGTVSKDSPIIPQGRFFAVVEEGELNFYTPFYPWPCTSFRLAQNYPPDAYFKPGETVPDLKLIRVVPENPVDIRSFLQGIDPVSELSIAENLGIDLSPVDDADLISQLPVGFVFEINEPLVQVEDPLITSIILEIQKITNPIDQINLPGNVPAILSPYRGRRVDLVIFDLLKDRPESFFPTYIDGFSYTSRMINSFTSLLGYPSPKSGK